MAQDYTLTVYLSGANISPSNSTNGFTNEGSPFSSTASTATTLALTGLSSGNTALDPLTRSVDNQVAQQNLLSEYATNVLDQYMHEAIGNYSAYDKLMGYDGSFIRRELTKNSYLRNSALKSAMKSPQGEMYRAAIEDTTNVFLEPLFGDVQNELGIANQDMLKRYSKMATTITMAAMQMNNINSLIKSNTQTIRGDFIGATNTQRSASINNYALSKMAMVSSMSLLGPAGFAVGVAGAAVSTSLDLLKYSEKQRMYSAENAIQQEIYNSQSQRISVSAKEFRS